MIPKELSLHRFPESGTSLYCTVVNNVGLCVSVGVAELEVESLRLFCILGDLSRSPVMVSSVLLPNAKSALR